MKTFLLVLIFISGVFYYFVPLQTKVELFGKVGIDISSLSKSEKTGKVDIKGGLVNFSFDGSNEAKYKGDISSGEIMTDLSWASLPYVKCFSKDESVNFNGKVVLHKIILPKYENVSVKLTKENPSASLSMYVYKTSLDNVLPPQVDYVYECKNDFTTSDTKIIEMKGNTAPSEIIIGVSGINGLQEGGYSLEVEAK